MPVAPGRNIAILVEVAARNQLLRAAGHHAARLLADAPRGTHPAAGAAAAARDGRGRRRGRPEIAERSGERSAGSGGRPHPAARQAPAGGRPFIVLTGLSGSGKSQAIRALEDLGLLLRRQPADHAHSDAGQAVAARRRHREGRHRRRRARGQSSVVVPAGLPPAAANARAQPGADLPRGEQRGAAAPVQRDAAAASAGAEPVGHARASARSARG